MLARTNLRPIAVRGPKAPPLLGPLGGVLRFFADPVGRMLDLHRDYGDLAAVVDGNAAIVCAFGKAHNHAVITAPSVFEHLSEVPITVRPGTAFSRFNNTILLMNAEAHRARRRLLMPAFSKAAIEGYAPEIAAVADEMIGRWPLGRTVDVAALLRDVTASIVIRCLFGLKDRRDVDALSALEQSLLACTMSPGMMALPFDIPGTPLHRALRLAERMEKSILEIIAEKRRSPGGTDALSRLIEARDENGSALSLPDLVGEINSLFAAGFDTSSLTLAWTLLLLALHPDVLDEVMEEVQVVLKGKPPTAEHVPALVRLDRVIKESMRLLPVAVLLFMRVCAEDAKLDGITLPKGAMVMLSPLLTHRDPEVYPSPRRFDPARWERLDPPLYTYLPFGVGARTCIGAPFAGLALRITLARVLLHARPAVPPGTRIDYEVRGPALGPKGGLRLSLLPPASRVRAPRVTGSIHALVDL